MQVPDKTIFVQLTGFLSIVTIVIGWYPVFLIIINCLVDQNCRKIIVKFSLVYIVNVLQFFLNVVY